jgi:hypothetical protein
MGKPLYTVEFTEDELRAIEMALQNANANQKDMRILLQVFVDAGVAQSARTAWNKTGKVLREITIGTKREEPEWRTDSANEG